MTYFDFLLRFVVLPIVILLVWAGWDRLRGKRISDKFRAWPVWGVLLLHSLIALVYTTPWDNYLVATRVWWYDEKLVTGITLGWVPIEEYTFFVLQPLFSGLLLVTLARYMKVVPPSGSPQRLRPILLALFGVLWLSASVILLAGWQPGTYLSLELIWALPPLMLQIAFGFDILWLRRRIIGVTLLLTTAYLALADSVAIGAGTWTINPMQSLSSLLIGGILPLEELLFFLLTNMMLSFGVTLILSPESHERFRSLVQRFAPQSPADLA